MSFQASDDDVLLPTGQVAKRYHRHVRSIDRWLSNSELGFPAPDMQVNGRRFWRLATLRRWELARAVPAEAAKAEAA
ncbi:hypothetical protein [Labrys monachus]|uniref:DNA-binding protein n=1 Tax=Labrys monachus TaxID=217067 RepID=A0ABU0FKZ5_9HYPH|nr:hypothetical protein [Labrys monachus]MDQ0395196.1 hypothetical protein [Labrys monachus]